MLFNIVRVIMCRPESSQRSDWKLDYNVNMNCVKKARRVVKKYKKMSLKKEMNRLRQIIPHGDTSKQNEVLDQTILLIHTL